MNGEESMSSSIYMYDKRHYHLILYFKTYIHILVGFIIVYENVDI
jgi:hypothetical protein